MLRVVIGSVYELHLPWYSQRSSGLINCNQTHPEETAHAPSCPELTWLDTTVVVVYCVGITLFGLWISRKTRTSGGYFLGGRQLPWWIMIGRRSARALMPRAGGTSGRFLSAWVAHYLVSVEEHDGHPVLWLMAPWYRRTKRTTVGEIVEDRMGNPGGCVSVFAISISSSTRARAQGRGQGDCRGHQ